jgi:hypothetical protein
MTELALELESLLTVTNPVEKLFTPTVNSCESFPTYIICHIKKSVINDEDLMHMQ